MRERGVIRRYFLDRGFGFIARSNATEIFFHVKQTNTEGFELREGVEVEFTARLEPDGRQRAVDVTVL
jgi:cold shock CspA family protein